MMNRPLPRLLIIDDSQSFLDAIKHELNNYFQLDTYHVQLQTKLEQILSFIKTTTPDYFLLDVNLHAPGVSQMILEEATQQYALLSSCKVWMISQAEENETEILEQFQALNNNVQNKLLPKPISALRLRGELLDETLFEPRGSFWTLFPLPMRVLSHQGKISYSNPHWVNPDYPDPGHKVHLWTDLGQAPGSKEYAGSFGKEAAGFRLHCFEVEQDEQLFLAQVAERYPLHDIPESLEEALQQIFDAMRQAGFSRGRFYRIRTLARHTKSKQYHQVLELQTLSYPIPDTLELPYRIPCEGELKKRLAGYARKPELQSGDLLFEIRTKDQDKSANDSWIDKLNTMLELGDLNSWLEVPVWIKNSENEFDTDADIGSEKRILAALLIFDRVIVPEQKNYGGRIDEEVSEANVEPIKPLLCSLLSLLSRALKQQFYQNLQRYEDKMRSFDQELVKLKDTDQRYQKVLEMLCKISGACSGIMVINKQPEPDYVDIVAAYGDQLPNAISNMKMRFSLAADHHPIVAAWKRGKPTAYQDFPSNGIKDVLKQHLQDDDQDYRQPTITNSEKAEFIEWLDSFHGNLAIPVQVATDETIGGITLQFESAGMITQHLVEQINAVLHRIRWIIQQARHERNERFDYWQKVLGHDLKTSLNIVDQNVNELTRMQPNLETVREWLKIKRYLVDAHDLTENWMDMMTDRLERRDECFRPTALDAYLDLSQLRLEDDKIDVEFIPTQDDPVWQTELSGNEIIFGRVIRILLDNAFKFGRHAINNDGTKVLIELQAELIPQQKQASAWKLSISNPGQMSKQAEQLCFIAGKIPDDSTTHGAHVGLSVAKRWVEATGGTLALQNKVDSHSVVAEITWPVAKSSKKDPGS